ncbi:hypothetical protein INS49_001471 [Diaporthe citri]|uniref:uncharacterized protein n=1 Tax=Diaporthe citri TaxID=83186 RepID=UPI001C7E9055|nr:uncharacterized protein INS49_001471 [Diaporthe citri]KAG6367284.1 hypothetical protein INS49_001471 [Diaporthe citri]
MDKLTATHDLAPRAPLGDKGKRGNSVPPRYRSHATKTYESDCKENVPNVVAEDDSVPRRPKTVTRPLSQPPVDPRLSVISQASRDQNASKRDSQVSNASASTARSNDSKIKTHIGPWQLGKTLSKGSSARVRLARHRLTHQSVAVKIISKKTAYLSQAGSIAQLDKVERELPEADDGFRRLPVTVEREIAIMKLIEHPNIIKILDVWENRNEIYLILEYCDSKDMFSYINRYGKMSERDAVYVFRQMMSAMEYCHSFNICHRDLKPENILLSHTGEVKIIDFGMAALHQNDKKLRTSCGSPHYAAPELLKAKTYRGDKTDIWSMGVILFAMLEQKLPFDDEHLPTMLSLSKRALYIMPDSFSPDAKDMIKHILVTEPDKRISIREMWDHPLIKKYDKFPGFEQHRRQPVDMRARSKDTPINARDIDPQILRPLRAMWHSADEKEITSKLLSKGPNEQKLFYHLLVSHRDRLLENYDPDLVHSTSDYHHLRPPAWTTRVSTRQFNVQGRAPSRFTVISTVADTEAGGTDGNWIFVAGKEESEPVDSLAHSNQQGHGGDIPASASIAGDQSTYDRDNTSPNSPRKKIKKEHDSTYSLRHIGASASAIDEEITHFSNSIARDCDDAFSSSLIGSPSDTLDRARTSLTPFSVDFVNAEHTIRIVESPTAMKSAGSSIIPRPLNVRKKSTNASVDTGEVRKTPQESDGQKKHSFHSRMPDLPEEPTTNGRSSSNGSSIGPRKKLSTWFRRNSRANSKGEMDETPDTSVVSEDQPRETTAAVAKPQRFDSSSSGMPPPTLAAQPSKKKSFMFWKTSKSDNRMSIAAPDYEDETTSFDATHRLSGATSLTQDGYGDSADAVARKIEPRQNWLARLFRVKPSRRYLCLQMSRRRARQEVTILLREWRKWGIRDVEVDKERNIVFARVGKKNFLNIKEVHFAVEIITVIEHGKRNHLSIVRFTQEKGAASSFHKVVDTMHSVFTSRGLLVQDSRKAKMMIKTLNS